MKISQQHPMANTEIQQYIQERVVKVDSEAKGSPATSTALIESYAEPDVYKIGIEVSDPGEEYVMSYSLRGLALIFNQEYFSPELRLPHRHGTKADKNNLLRRLEELSFAVRPYDNLTRQEVRAVIDDAVNWNHAEADCFLCVFLSHGENECVFARDGKLSIRDLTHTFKGDRCSSLVGKPKIFIFQDNDPTHRQAV